MTQTSQLLIVEDAALRRAALRRAVIECGVEAVETRDVAEAIALANRESFAAILVGATLALADDGKLLRRLQRAEAIAVVPILVVSQIESASDRERVHALGAVDYLVSPLLEVDVLQQKLRVFIGLHRRRLAMEALLLRLREDSEALFRQNEHLLAAQRQILQRATHDGLTGLPNRELFEDRLGAAIRRSERGRKCFAVATVGLDDVATIADREGAAAADEWRVQAAGRIAAAVRASDTVARIGVDDFAVLIEAIDAPRRAAALGAKLVTALQRPLRLTATASGRPWISTPKVSAGLSVYPNDALDAQGLMMLSGLAQSRAQQHAEGVACVYADDLAAPAAVVPTVSAVRARLN